MSVDQGLAVLGIGITVALGLAALIAAKVVKNRRQAQQQRVGKNSIGIQSGRDTKIGGK